MQLMAEKMQLLLLHAKPNIIPNDIIIEILLRLPVKSLLRFRWACKYLFDLITNSDNGSFIKMHLHRSTTTSTTNISPILNFCFVNGDRMYKKLSLGYYLNYNDTTCVVTSEVNESTAPKLIFGILGSSNGLILLLIEKSCMCILNPCTKEYRVIPSPPSIELVDNDKNLIRGNTYGFGYDQTINDYKVIRIIKYLDDIDGLSDVQVYTLGTNLWRRIIVSNLSFGLQDCWTGPGVFLNGALYWMDSSGLNLVSFDVGKEKFHVLKTPIDRLNYSHKLQVIEGSLCLVLTINPVEIWVMKDYIVSNNTDALWTKLLTLPNLDYYSRKLLRILRYTSNGEMLILNSYKDLVLYDPKNISYRCLGKICEDCTNLFMLEVYTESLVSLNSRTYDKENNT